MSLCLIARFKNERHIMYEFVNHYLQEGVDCLILVDDNSDDDYMDLNKDWMDNLIETKKIIIKKATLDQHQEYNLHLNEIKKFEWVIMCDMDEFMFSVPDNSTLKSLINTKLSSYDSIRVPWKLFNHNCYYQPQSVINDNVYTHQSPLDSTSPSKGYKYIVRTNTIIKLKIHDCIIKTKSILTICDCHNNLIQNNHYRTQSEEYLRGVKEMRGGGVRKEKYKGFAAHKQPIYTKQCRLLINKRKKLINNCLSKQQVNPKIYTSSSFAKEQHNM